MGLLVKGIMFEKGGHLICQWWHENLIPEDEKSEWRMVVPDYQEMEKKLKALMRSNKDTDIG